MKGREAWKVSTIFKTEIMASPNSTNLEFKREVKGAIKFTTKKGVLIDNDEANYRVVPYYRTEQVDKAMDLVQMYGVQQSEYNSNENGYPSYTFTDINGNTWCATRLPLK